MADLIFRRANKDDFPSIRALIHEVGINPTGLDWRRFIIVVNSVGELVACGQIKPHRDSSRELASIAVRSQDRGQGVAKRLIQHLLEDQPRPLYLMCRGRLGQFYNQVGFRAIGLEEMPPYFRRIARLVHLFNHSTEDGLLVMQLD